MALARRMLKLMRKNNGIGLSANQAGVAKRMFVMESGGQDMACWNPEIERYSDETVTLDEGCLSFQQDRCRLTRPASIDVLYYNCVGKPMRAHLTGISSRCFQHELDHLNGITMWDRLKEQNAKQS